MRLALLAVDKVAGRLMAAMSEAGFNGAALWGARTRMWGKDDGNDGGGASTGPATRTGGAAGARDLELRRRSAERTVDENLRLFRRNSFHADGYRRRTVLEPADDFLWPSDPSGRRDLVGAGSVDLDSRHHRICLCRMARRGALSRSDRAAIAVRAGLRLADRCRACHANQHADRAARG